MAKKKNNIVVERIGEHTGRPITTTAVPVKWTLNSGRAPLNVQPNGTIIQSIVTKDGTNEQTFYKSNMEPSFGFIINGTDSTAVKYNPHTDIGYMKKYKPGTSNFKEIANKAAQYNVPVVTYDEAYDNLEEVERQTEKFQPGGSIAGRIWNRLTGKDTYVDGYGVTRRHAPVRESAHRTLVKAADSPLIQAIPVIGDLADGYVAADYAAKGDYKPAIAAIGAGLVLPNVMEVAARIPSPKIYSEGLDWAVDKANDFVEVLGIEPISKKSDDLVEVLDATPSRRRGRTSDRRFDTMHDSDPIWVPEEVNTTEGYDSVFDYDGNSQSNEPWWGWDPIEYQEGGEIPSNSEVSFLENLPYGRHNVDKHNKLVEMGKRFGKNIPGPIKPESLPNKYQPAVPPVKMPMHKQNIPNTNPAPIPNPGISNDQMPQEVYQEGGNLPSGDQQQQLFIAIITDMAKTLGVEPSQELAEAVMAAFENNDDSQGLLTLFTKTKDKFMNETGLFREGGKMYAFVEKFKCGGKSPKKKIAKKEEGGDVDGAGAGYITTPVNDRQMRRNWREATGGTRREARQAQRNLTNYIEGQGGISHGGARNAAAAMMGDPQRFAAPTQTPTLKPMGQAQINASTPTLSAPKDISDMNYDNLGFNQAFGRARGNGVDTFTWRGKEYTTELAQPQQQAQQQPQSTVERTVESGSLNAPTVTGRYPDYYYNNLYNVGANWRARREARRAARNGGGAQ